MFKIDHSTTGSARARFLAFGVGWLLKMLHLSYYKNHTFDLFFGNPLKSIILQGNSTKKSRMWFFYPSFLHAKWKWESRYLSWNSHFQKIFYFTHRFYKENENRNRSTCAVKVNHKKYFRVIQLKIEPNFDPFLGVEKCQIPL